MKLLLADDDKSSLSVLKIILERENFELSVASDGDEALHSLLSSEPPDIAVLDWMMPGQSGVDLCRKIREFDGDKYTYIILLTAKTREEDIIAGLEAGADDYLTKPYNTREFLLRVQAGKRVVEMHNTLRRHNEFLQNLNYTLAHDLRTPLVAINMTTEQVLEGLYGPVSDDVRSIVAKTRESIFALLRMTDGIRTLARFEHTSPEVTIQQINVARIAQECIAELQPLSSRKSIRVDLQLEKKRLGAVGNSQDVRRLLINLLDNAIKFSPEGGRILIDLRQEASHIVCKVQDEGPGVPPQDIPNLFKQFSVRMGQRRGSSSGLGLYLCKRIVDSLSGSLSYERNESGGGAFVFRIPAVS